MENQDVFGRYHPVVNFLYFGILLAFSMVSMQPVCLILSVIGAVAYYVVLKGAKAVRLLLRGALPLFLLAVIINPAFSHEGITILCYLPTGNPLTLESIIYGVFAGFMIIGILLWFACFTEVVTSDKFMYLFGRIIPALSLVISMTLRFVPRFTQQFQTVKEVQKTMGRDTTTGSLLKRVRNAVTCFSIVVTWSLENAIETSDSMKSRGYGIRHRTAYSIYSWASRDKTALLFLVFCGLFLLTGGLSGNLYWRYFPSIQGILSRPVTLAVEFVFLLLCLMPVYLNRRESRYWNSLRSSI